MTKRSDKEEGTACFPAGSVVLAKSRLARYVAMRDVARLALASCALALCRAFKSATTELSPDMAPSVSQVLLLSLLFLNKLFHDSDVPSDSPRGSARSDFDYRKRNALICGQHRVFSCRNLVQNSPPSGCCKSSLGTGPFSFLFFAK
jgi:hypothetical protein